ncbi:hypothetical protein DN619_08595 [Klebsiella michiganensis]|nr:hypothetical protein [Klebsiella michiganensis]RWT46158.1 hypothetical protein DN619_08595 [Klebsiella michiganensis]
MLSVKDNVASATARRASEATHPARPTNVKKRPKGAFLLSAISSKITTIRNTLMLRYSTVALRLPWLQLAQANSPDRCVASPPGNVPGLMPLRGFVPGAALDAPCPGYRFVRSAGLAARTDAQHRLREMCRA